MIIVRELGFANIAMGMLALITLRRKGLRKTAAITYGIYIVGCISLHIERLGEIQLGELTSLVGDLWLLLVVVVVVATGLVHKEA